MERKNAWKEYTEAEVSELEKLNESYRKFLDAGKTERECVKQAVAMAEAAGYLDLKKVIKEGKQVKAGDKLYAVNMKKSLALFQIGKQPLEKGMAILGAHIDSPRLDIKQNPLYEDGGFAKKHLLSVNGWLLPAKKETAVLPMGVHPDALYRRKTALLYDPDTSRGFYVERKAKDFFATIGRCFKMGWLLAGKYKKTVKDFQKNCAELISYDFWKEY